MGKNALVKVGAKAALKRRGESEEGRGPKIDDGINWNFKEASTEDVTCVTKIAFT